MAKPRNPIQTLIAETLAARNRDADAVAEICRQAFAKMVDGKPIPAELQQQYDRLSPSITLETRLEALKLYYKHKMAQPEPAASASQEASADQPAPDTAAPNSLPNAQFWHRPTQPVLPPQQPNKPNIDTAEEKLRKAQAREAFKRWTGLLSWRDKNGGGSGGNDSSGDWLGN